MNLRIIRALMIKTLLIWRKSTFRIAGLFFFPLMNLVIWGMVTRYMLQISNTVPALIIFLVGAIILWSVLQRAQETVNLVFMEDIWAKNLLNMFAAPIKIGEYLASAYLLGFVQAIIVLILLSATAYFYYGFNILALGMGLGLFFINLLFMGWSLGLLISGIVLKWGHQAEILVWAIGMLMQPLSAVFYPVKVLPQWVQPIALSLPSTHVFEGMRDVLLNHQIN